MLTLNIDGRAVQLSADDCRFLAECLHAGLSHRGHRFERTHKGAHGTFRVSAGETVREQLPPGVVAFNHRVAATGTPDADTAPVLVCADGQRVRMPGFSRCGIAARNRTEAAAATRAAAFAGVRKLTDC